MGQSDIKIGHDLESCTDQVRSFSCPHPNGSDTVVFVDTPGFDDTNLKDTEILRAIANWLTATYKQQIKLTGLLWFHRISDNRMSGSPLKNLSLFEKLCGKGALQNVILTTTMWDKVDNSTGSMREEQLRKMYWKSMIDAGSDTARFLNSCDSVWEIINRFTGPRRALKLQVEMVDKGLELAQTAAGATIFQWLGDLIDQFRVLIQLLEARLRAISKGTDPEEAAEIVEKKLATERKVEQANNQLHLLKDNRPGRRGHRAKTSFRTGSKSGRTSRPMPNVSPPLPQSRSGGDTRKELDSFESHGRKLAETITALKHARNVAENSSLSPFKGAIQLILTIAESVEIMESNDQSLTDLAHNAGTLILTIEEQERIGGISDDMKHAVDGLSEQLQEVKALVQTILSRGPTSQHMFESDEKVVSTCNSKIIFTRSLVEMESAINNNDRARMLLPPRRPPNRRATT